MLCSNIFGAGFDHRLVERYVLVLLLGECLILACPEPLVVVVFVDYGSIAIHKESFLLVSFLLVSYSEHVQGSSILNQIVCPKMTIGLEVGLAATNISQ